MSEYAEKQSVSKKLPPREILRESRGQSNDSLLQMASLLGNQGMLAYLEQQKKSKPAATGEPLADTMREKFERKSGVPLDDVRVHYSSDKPEQLGAEAYAQGNEIHIGPGNEKDLEHEIGHVVQQKQGLVKATGTLNGKNINTDPVLESEASTVKPIEYNAHQPHISSDSECIQGVFITGETTRAFYEYYRGSIMGHRSRLFSPATMNFASASLDDRQLSKIGSLYFTNPTTHEGGRIRLTHRDGPHVSRHNDIERYAIPTSNCDTYAAWAEQHRHSSIQSFHEELLAVGAGNPQERIADPTQTIVEIWRDGRHISDHISRGFSDRPPQLNDTQINLLRAAAEFAEDEGYLQSYMRYSDRQRPRWSGNWEIFSDTRDSYYSDLKNDFLRLIMWQNGISISVDQTRYYDRPYRTEHYKRRAAKRSRDSDSFYDTERYGESHTKRREGKGGVK